eukprot:COSAG05_NODE_10350_length_570_cov_0.859873_1_plen_80_part_10
MAGQPRNRSNLRRINHSVADCGTVDAATHTLSDALTKSSALWSNSTKLVFITTTQYGLFAYTRNLSVFFFVFFFVFHARI